MLCPPERFSNQVTKGLHQWNVQLGQWSPVSEQTLGGAEGYKSNCVTSCWALFCPRFLPLLFLLVLTRSLSLLLAGHLLTTSCVLSYHFRLPHPLQPSPVLRP